MATQPCLSRERGITERTSPRALFFFLKQPPDVQTLLGGLERSARCLEMKENGEIFFFLNVALSWVLNPNLKGAVFVFVFFSFSTEVSENLKRYKDFILYNCTTSCWFKVWRSFSVTSRAFYWWWWWWLVHWVVDQVVKKKKDLDFFLFLRRFLVSKLHPACCWLEHRLTAHWLTTCNCNFWWIFHMCTRREA